MVYYVIEFQTNAGVGSAIVTTYSNEQQARSKYHEIMAAASISNIQKHGAMIVTEDLFKLMAELAPKAAPQAE